LIQHDGARLSAVPDEISLPVTSNILYDRELAGEQLDLPVT
jgi:hypothetical protein